MCPDDNYISKLNLTKFKYKKIYLLPRKISFLTDIILIFQFYFLLRREKPDLFIPFTIKPNLYGSFITNLLSIKTINNFTGLGNLFHNHILKKMIIKILLRLSIKKSNFIFFHNNEDHLYFIKNGLCNNFNSFVVPGSGIDLTKFSEKNISLNKVEKDSFIFFGRIMRDKGIIEYLDAAEAVKKINPLIKFSVLGSIEYSERKVVKKLNLSIKNNIIKYYAFTDNIFNIIEKYECVILPSYHEGMSKALLESAALYKPIIASDIPGIREIVINQINGYLFEKKNTQDLITKIKLFLSDNQDTKKLMSSNSRKVIEKNFNEKFVLNKYLKEISNILK
tara:strand:+ start:2048 stop:3055 length:1008 start_codon:yes stop_codon:yes gene_type:complete